MIAHERARADGIDAVAIMTPNDTTIRTPRPPPTRARRVADKARLARRAQARDLVARAQRGRAAVRRHPWLRRLPDDAPGVAPGRAGDIGAVRSYRSNTSRAPRGEDRGRAADDENQVAVRPAAQRPAQVMSAIGCHAQHLACFVTGCGITRVAAEPGRRAGRACSIMCPHWSSSRADSRAPSTAFQAAAGAENDIRLRVYGERGMVDWSHASAATCASR